MFLFSPQPSVSAAIFEEAPEGEVTLPEEGPEKPPEVSEGEEESCL